MLEILLKYLQISRSTNQIAKINYCEICILPKSTIETWFFYSLYKQVTPKLCTTFYYKSTKILPKKNCNQK